MEAKECPGCRERDRRIVELEAMVGRLQAQVLALEGMVRDLTDKLKSLTKPPMSPRPVPELPAGPAKKPTGRSPGAQKGHPPQLKKRLPPERLKEIIAFVPKSCRHCAAALPSEPGAADRSPSWHQVVELPALAAEIREYQGHYRTCPSCGEVNHATIPEDIRAHSFGPRLSAALSYLAGSHGMSKRAIEEVAEALFDAPIALGSVANLEQEISAALAGVHQEAVDHVAAAAVKNVDETGWKENGKKRWLWVAATSIAAVFLISPWRNLRALRRLLPGPMRGILSSDRWRVYDEWPQERRQVCWAHLKRNWEKLVERGGKAKIVGQGCLEVQRRVFELWHLYRGGGCTRTQLGDGLAPLLLELAEWLRLGYRSRDRKLVRFCQRLAAVYPALWTFAERPGVEPTNNHGERVLRRAVLWRRRSFGCHSAAGCRFVERILTVVQTLRLQQRPVLAYLYEAIQAHRSGVKVPGLLATG